VLGVFLAGCSLEGLGSFSTDPPATASPSPTPSTDGSADPNPSTAPTPAPTPSPSASPTAAPTDVLFGFAGHLMWDSEARAMEALDLLAEDEMDVVRFDVSWRNTEPQRGRFEWLGKLDAIVAAANARNIRPIITVLETPGWANGGRGPWHPPERAADYASFVGMLAARYPGRVYAWEIWNEPDIGLFWDPEPDPERYTEMLLAASAAVRAADPAALVVAGGVTFGNFGFLQAMYDAGAQGSFDALAVHPYSLTRAPDDERDRTHSLTRVLDDAHAVMTANGEGHVPIWITELGWAIVGANSVSPEKRVEYLAQSVDLIREKPFVDVVTAYTIDVRHSARHGLSTNGRRSAAWKAYVGAVHAGR
jgi:polysaccharide biosynthesis protein PslG